MAKIGSSCEVQVLSGDPVGEYKVRLSGGSKAKGSFQSARVVDGSGEKNSNIDRFPVIASGLARETSLENKKAKRHKSISISRSEGDACADDGVISSCHGHDLT